MWVLPTVLAGRCWCRRSSPAALRGRSTSCGRRRVAGWTSLALVVLVPLAALGLRWAAIRLLGHLGDRAAAASRRGPSRDERLMGPGRSAVIVALVVHGPSAGLRGAARPRRLPAPTAVDRRGRRWARAERVLVLLGADAVVGRPRPGRRAQPARRLLDERSDRGPVGAFGESAHLGRRRLRHPERRHPCRGHPAGVARVRGGPHRERHRPTAIPTGVPPEAFEPEPPNDDVDPATWSPRPAGRTPSRADPALRTRGR